MPKLWHDFAYSVKIVVPSDVEKGDVTDYLEAGNSKNDLLKLIEDTKWIYAPWLNLEGNRMKVNVDILAACVLRHNYVFVARNPGSESDVLYWYIDGVYKRMSKTEVIQQIKSYMPIGTAANNTLENAAKILAYSCKALSFSEINRNENIINLKNGLYNVASNEFM